MNHVVWMDSAVWNSMIKCYIWLTAQLWLCAFIMKDRKKDAVSLPVYFPCSLICRANSDDNERSVRPFGSAPAGNRHVKLSKSSTFSHCAAADNYSTWRGLHSFSPEFSQVNCTQSTTHDCLTPVDIQQISVSMTVICLWRTVSLTGRVVCFILTSCQVSTCEMRLVRWDQLFPLSCGAKIKVNWNAAPKVAPIYKLKSGFTFSSN